MNERNTIMEEVLIDMQKSTTQSNKVKDRIIILLIILMFIEAVVSFSSFVWYESQFETVTTTDADIIANGTDSNAQYIGGDSYNDTTTHNE